MANAIERRLKEVDRIWIEATSDPSHCIYVFRGSYADLQLLDLHVEMQAEKSDLPDLFIRLNSNFLSFDYFGRMLIEEFSVQYEASKPDLQESFDFIPPDIFSDSKLNSIPDLLAIISSFTDIYGDSFRLLAIIISPDSVSDSASFRNWLISLAKSYRSERVRFLLFERLDAPLVPEIEDELSDLVLGIPIDLDMQGAFEELVRGEGDDGPGKDFQLHMLGIASASEKGNVAAARRSAWKARDVARKNNWPEQEVVAHASFGAALISARRFDEAVEVYRAAEPVAERLCEANHPAGPKLLVTVVISEASALFAAEKLEQASMRYEEAAERADQLEDPLMALDAWRMAGYCSESMGRKRDAWRQNYSAMDIAKRLVESARKATSLAYVGDALLRLVGEFPNADEHAARIHEQMVDLLGDGWHAHVENAESTNIEGVA